MTTAPHTPVGHGGHENLTVWVVLAAFVLLAVAVDLAIWLDPGWLLP